MDLATKGKDARRSLVCVNRVLIPLLTDTAILEKAGPTTTTDLTKEANNLSKLLSGVKSPEKFGNLI